MAGSLPLATTPDWSMLPPEMLQTIARKLPDISDFVRFRAVCTSWRSSACVSNPPPQFPWILDQECYFESNLRNLRFYSLSSGKIHTFPSPNSSGDRLRGSVYDYIVLHNEASCQISLLNPLTGRKVVLPDFPSLDISRLRTIWVLPDPIESGEPVVFSGHSADFKTGNLMLYQPVAREWVVIEEPILLWFRCYYFNGMYYVIDENGDTIVIDTVTRKVVHVLPPPPVDDYKCDSIMHIMGARYLVQSGGDILQVVFHFNYLIEMADCHFHIHRLDLRSVNGGQPRWVEISSIGDQILFLDEINAFSLSCRDFSGFRGNSIYFIRRYRDIHGQSLRLLRRYDIEEARDEPLNCPFVNAGIWIVPSLR